ncbi:MAG: hypothetical protein A4E60_01440 [Syntrophorhabdus sp. PtaB.Bin047]|jgi:hypothetical protein|nr:MAG: hypothetical protein A4E60_01440 [Syntrophorhabdus sp. PtaB.Bin047]
MDVSPVISNNERQKMNARLEAPACSLSGGFCGKEHGKRTQARGSANKEANAMIREIRFIVTDEVRKPKLGDWFLNRNNFPICAVQDFNVTKFPILKMEVFDDQGKAVETRCAGM